MQVQIIGETGRKGAGQNCQKMAQNTTKTIRVKMVKDLTSVDRTSLQTHRDTADEAKVQTHRDTQAS